MHIHVCIYIYICITSFPAAHVVLSLEAMQHTIQTATHCNTLHNTAVHCTTHCNTLQYTATHCTAPHQLATHCTTLYHTVPHCTTLRQTAPHGTALHHTTPQCTTLHHTAPHCTTLHRVSHVDPPRVSTFLAQTDRPRKDSLTTYKFLPKQSAACTTAASRHQASPFT